MWNEYDAALRAYIQSVSTMVDFDFSAKHTTFAEAFEQARIRREKVQDLRKVIAEHCLYHGCDSVSALQT